MKFKLARFDIWEVGLIGGALIAATAILAVRLPSTSNHLASMLGAEGLKLHAELERTYGAGAASQFDEEWIIRDFFHDLRNGVFLDVGANHYQRNNLTYFLETSLGWSGVAIDAQEEYGDGFRQHRPRTRFFVGFVSDVSDGTARLYIPENVRVEASEDRSFAAKADTQLTTREVPTITLNDLLAKAGLAHIDFLGMDIELAEPKALKGFDIERFRPSLVCIEDHPEVRQAILDYFHQHQYVLVGKYMRTDPVNLYFMPASGSPRS